MGRDADRWELYDLTRDYSQAHDLAAERPERLEAMKARFLEVAKDNKVFPIGGGLWLRIHPEDRIASPYHSWVFDATTTRMPEFTAPGLGRQSSRVTIDAEIGENASGVLYALGGSSGGLALYLDDGELVYEYNMMLIERYEARSAEPIPAGQRVIEVATTIERPGAPADVVLQRRRRGGGADHRRADGARRVHGVRDIRRRRRSWRPRLPRLRRTPSVRLHRYDRVR